MFGKKLTILGLWLLSISSIAMEDDDLIALYDEEELISIATGTEKQIRFAPSVATVITSREIQEIGARTLDEALEMVPGLHVSRSFNRQDAIYSFRGIHTGQNPQVLLLVDGVRVQQLFSGARPYNFELPAANIERIEVIRGPGSAIYGADAFAGVISVTTKTHARDEKSSTGFRAGSFQTKDVWLREHENWRGIDVNLSVEYATSEGDRDQTVGSDFLGSLPQAMPLANDIEHWHTRAQFSKENWSLGLFHWNLVSAGLGSGGAQVLDETGRDEAAYFGVQFENSSIQLTDDLDLSFYIGLSALEMDARFVLFPPGSPGFPDGMLGNPRVEEEVQEFEINFDYSALDDHKVRIGAGLRFHELDASETKNFDGNTFAPLVGGLTNVTGTSDIFIKDGKREHYFIYIQDEWALANDWQATIGVRYDDFTQFGESINPRAALVWSTTHKLTTKLMYGRAFRAPSFSELFSRNNPSLIGNPSLEPETIDTYELAFDYRLAANLATRLNFFYYEIDDLIEISFGAVANSGSQDGQGLELEVEWDASQELRLIANFAMQNSEQESQTGSPKFDVPNAPSRQAFIKAQWQISHDRSLNLIANWVSDRERAIGDSRNDIDDYTKVDAVFRSATHIDGLDMALIVKNIFDEDVAEPSGSNFPEDYPGEGRSIALELVYTPDS